MYTQLLWSCTDSRADRKMVKKNKVLWFVKKLRHRLGLLERVPKLVSEWSGDGGKVEKSWVENRHCVTLLQCACTVESENSDFWTKETVFEKRLWTWLRQLLHTESRKFNQQLCPLTHIRNLKNSSGWIQRKWRSPPLAEVQFRAWNILRMSHQY